MAVAPELGKPEMARELLQALFRSAASQQPDLAAGTLAIRLPERSSRARDKAFGALIEELNCVGGPDTDLRMVDAILPTLPSRPAGA